MTDAEFEAAVEQIKRGEQAGLKEIYTAYVSFIYTIVLDKLHNRENAEDVTSDFFIKLWKIADKYNKGNGHKAWMATIARNMAIDFLRKHKREELSDMMEETAENSEGDSYGKNIYGGAIDKPVEDSVVSEMNLQEVLQELKEDERQIVMMKVLADMTFKDVAASLEMPMGTVTWKYQNAIKKLRRLGYE